MTATTPLPGNSANTFLTHLFGTGLKDDRYVVEKFRALVNGEIRRAAEPAPAKGRSRRKAPFPTATLKAVREMRPARNEIIICTGTRSRGGVQYWGSVSAGLFCDRRQRG